MSVMVENGLSAVNSMKALKSFRFVMRVLSLLLLVCCVVVCGGCNFDWAVEVGRTPVVVQALVEDVGYVEGHYEQSWHSDKRWVDDDEYAYDTYDYGYDEYAYEAYVGTGDVQVQPMHFEDYGYYEDVWVDDYYYVYIVYSGTRYTLYGYDNYLYYRDFIGQMADVNAYEVEYKDGHKEVYI